MAKEFKYKIDFSSIIKTAVPEEKNSFLAKASLDELRKFIPDIDEKNVDLLPFSTDAYVVNHVNLNGAVVDAATAVDTIDLFIYKQCNLEHDRNKIVGVLLNASFSEFGTNKLISKEDARKMTEPFNVTVGGVIWRVINANLIEYLEDTNNPSSPNYQKVSASYEMGYDDFEIAVLPIGSRNLVDAQIIRSGEEKARLSKVLKTFGGTGRTDDGQEVAILLKGEVTPLGIGLTENPAAAVQGLAVPQANTENLDNEDDANMINIEEFTQKFQQTIIETIQTELKKQEENVEKISHLENSNVKKNNGIMKITSLKDITDEALASKTIVASSIETFVNEELLKANDQWVKEKEEKDNAIKSTQEKAAELEKTNLKLQADLDALKSTVSQLQTEKAAKEQQEKFNARMASFDVKYELTDEDRAAIAFQVKNVADENFESVEKNLSVLLQAKDKEVIAKKKEVVASVTTTTEVVNTAIETAVPITPVPAATTTPAPKTLKEKFSKAFAEDQFIIEYNRGR